MSDAQSEQRKIQREIDRMTPDELDRYYGRGKYDQGPPVPPPTEYDDEDDEWGYD